MPSQSWLVAVFDVQNLNGHTVLEKCVVQKSTSGRTAFPCCIICVVKDRRVTQAELEHVRDVFEREVAGLKEELRAVVSQAPRAGMRHEGQQRADKQRP